MACELCNNTGWMAILVDGVRRMTRCTHLAAERAEREKQRPGGFTAIGEVIKPSPGCLSPKIEDLLAQRPVLAALLTREDLVVAKLIQVHIGKAAAIRIKDLMTTLGQGWTERDVKAALEKLRTLAGMPIVGSKEPPYGLFLPATAAECDEAFDRYVREGIKLFMIAKLVKPSANLVQHLRGQLEL